MKKILPLIILLFFTTACTKTTTVRHTEKFEIPLAKSNKTLLLPPEIELYHITASHKHDRLYDYEDYLEDTIIDQFIDHMDCKNYKVQFFTRREIGQNKLSREVVDTKDESADTLKILYDTELWPAEKAYTINQIIPAAAMLGEKTNADIIVIMHVYSAALSTGASMKHIATSVALQALTGIRTGGSGGASFMIRIAFLDAKTGSVLWSNSYKGEGGAFNSPTSFIKNNKKDTKTVKALFKEVLKPLPMN